MRDRRVHCLVGGGTGYSLGVYVGIFEDVWPERHGSVFKEARGIKRDDDKSCTIEKCSIVINSSCVYTSDIPILLGNLPVCSVVDSFLMPSSRYPL